MAEPKKRTAVLISGRGSNMSALIEAAKSPDYPAEIALVLSNRADAAGLQIARASGIAVAVAPGKREAREAALQAALREAQIDLVCLAGFMRILSADFVEAWRDRMINVHPSLLPLFPGLETHARALASGVKLHGATVHFVRAEMDAGPIIAQGAVPVLSDDDADTLAARVLKVEHRIYPHALGLVAAGRATVKGEMVEIEGAGVAPGATLLSPPD